MRIAKAVSVKAARAGKTYGKKPETVLYGLALVICAVMTVSCFAGRQTVSASEDNEEWNDFFNEETVAAMVKEIESSQTGTDSASAEAGQTNLSDTQSDNSDAANAGDSGLSNSDSNNAGTNNSGSDNSSGSSSTGISGNGGQTYNGSGGSNDSQGGGSGSDAPANTTFKADGTYTGSAVCETYNYNVTVTIVISGDTITSVTAESEAGAQDVQYFNMANAKVPAQLLANQSTSGVDAVAGATKSSNAIKKAFYYAYKSAKK